MHPGLVSLCALATIAGAQGARALAAQERPPDHSEPFAPSPTAAPFLSLGYREVAADLLFFRLVGYVGGKDYTADGVASLAEAVQAMDPRHRKIYEWGALAMMLAARKDNQIDNATFLRAVKLLERGELQFPTEFKYPELAGEVYLVDLQTKDPAQRRQWDELGVELLNRAVRKPNAPASLGTWVAQLRTKLGQKERAKKELRELIQITDDEKALGDLIAKLAELENVDSADVALEVLDARKRFEAQWRHDRPYMPQSLYILIGPTPKPGFDPEDLATGGRDLVGADFVDVLEPVVP